MILGIGMDLCAIGRMARSLQNERFATRVFTEGERHYCRQRGEPHQHFAARFAAKEATLKALGVPKGLRWHEMEVVSGAGGAPQLVLSGAAAAAATAQGVTRLHLTLTHTHETAAAVVVAEGTAPAAATVPPTPLGGCP